MHLTPDLPERRSVRLKQFDYAQAGAWFITICAQEKKRMFGKIVDGTVQLYRIAVPASRSCALTYAHVRHRGALSF